MRQIEDMVAMAVHFKRYKRAGTPDLLRYIAKAQKAVDNGDEARAQECLTKAGACIIGWMQRIDAMGLQPVGSGR